RPPLPSPARPSATLQAERAWQEAVQELQRAQRDLFEFVGDLWANQKDAPPGTVDPFFRAGQERVRELQRLVTDAAQVVQEKARELQEARERSLQQGRD
ncbi:MAG TPA: hypothetical protein VG013_03030, partial [Gemmataceae bacterium]|nr:hypothetical protein [Gemmataceae bacterium]